MTTTIRASPQTLADSAPQLLHHDPLHTYHAEFNQMALPDPTKIQPSLAKRRSRADRRLLFELGRTKNISKRRSSHRAMGKWIFFLLSGRHHRQDLMPPSHEIVLRLDTKSSSLVSPCRLPSFREGFSDWVQDNGQLGSIRSKIALNTVSKRQENTGLQLPSIVTTLGREWA